MAPNQILTCFVQIRAPIFFFLFLPLLVAIHCSKLSSYTIYRKTNKANWKKWQKKNTLGPILAQTWVSNFFSWVLPLPDVRDCCKLSIYAISRKSNEPNLRKWTNFGSLGPNLNPKNYFCGFYHNLKLDIVASYHSKQFQGKLIIKTQENSEKPNSGPDLGHWA